MFKLNLLRSMCSSSGVKGNRQGVADMVVCGDAHHPG